MIVLLSIGVSCLGQQPTRDSTEQYVVKGWMIHNSMMKMLRGQQMSVELDSLRSETLSLIMALDACDSLNNVRSLRIDVLEQINANNKELVALNEKTIIEIAKENKKKRIRQGVMVGGICFSLGVAVILIFNN